MTTDPGVTGEPRTLDGSAGGVPPDRRARGVARVVIAADGRHGHPCARPEMAGTHPAGRGGPRLRDDSRRTVPPSTRCSPRGLHPGQAAERPVRPQAGVLRRHPRKRPVDVLVDTLEMCHRLEFGDRLRMSRPTLPLAELLLSKLQVVKINKKDVLDALILLAEHPLADDDGALEPPDAHTPRTGPARSTSSGSPTSRRTTGAGGGR